MKKSRKKRLRRLAERVVNRQRKKNEHGSLTGTIRMTLSGFGFVTPDPDYQREDGGDIFIPAKYTLRALDGDQVRVELVPARRSRPDEAPKGPAGKVVEIIHRERTGLVGELLAGNLLRPLDPKLPDAIVVQGARKGAKRGDWVRIMLDDENDRWTGHIREVIGKAGVVQADLDAVMAEYDLPPRYSEKEELEAAALQARPIERKDYTGLFTLTIDPFDAKDFDDALSLSAPDENGCVTLGVHISDVAAYVSPKSKVDQWAKERGFSCYLPGRTLPMLPSKLTAAISLQQGQRSMAHTVFLTVNSTTGEVVSASRCHTEIIVDKRLDYDEVQGFIDSGKAPESWGKTVTDTVKNLTELTRKMRDFREENEKFIDLPIPEVRVICDEAANRISGLTVKISREAENLVEECMLAANQAVGRELLKRNIAGIFRVHAIPEAEKSMEFADNMADCFNLFPGDISNREVCRKFVSSLPDDGRRNVILNLLLRAMPRAMYSAQNDIHFALGKSGYCHFTSPIRRYTDLLVHQQLWNSDCKIRTRSTSTVETVAAWCCEMEECVDNASFAAGDRMKLRYLEEEFSANAMKVYEGVVVKVLNAGLQVDIGELGIYGFVKKEKIRGEFFRRNRKLYRDDADRGNYKAGDYIYLQLESIDFARGTAYFVPAGR